MSDNRVVWGVLVGFALILLLISGVSLIFWVFCLAVVLAIPILLRTIPEDEDE